MRVAVAGATGQVGRQVVETLGRTGHEAIPIARSHGIDLMTGAGLDEALAGVEAVIDATSTTDPDPAEFFATATQHLLAAEERAGVGHHVVLSIVGVDRVEGNPHYAGKRRQEELVRAASIPWTIVRATQFHDFAEMVVGWTRDGDAAIVPPLLVQPVAVSDVADVLVEVATAPPQHGQIDLAGPEPQDLVDMARRTLAVRGESVRLIPSWHGPLNVEMAGDVLLPGPDARIAPTTFDAWLAAQG
jgi:uncharacterized protein YbjT (DUF2867 family)